MKAKSNRFLFVVGLTATVGLAAVGCGDAGAFDGEELIDTSEEAHHSRCTWIWTQTGATCDVDPPDGPGQPPGPQVCQPEYGYIQVCQDSVQYCTPHCQYCYG